MFNLILSLGQDVVSYETLNDGITLDISLTSSVLKDAHFAIGESRRLSGII